MRVRLRLASLVFAAAFGLLGATPGPQPMGGANATKALEGCTGKALFNGVSRVIVSPPQKTNDGNWSTPVVVRNGTSSAITLAQMGITAASFQIAFGDDDVRPAAYFNGADGASWSPVLGFSMGPIPPGTGKKFTVMPSSGGAAAPTKLIVLVDKKSAKTVHFSVPDPSFRVHLDCKA